MPQNSDLIGKVVITHKTCGKAAFLYAHAPVSGERILRENAFHLDGKTFDRFGHLCLCGTCGGLLKGSPDLRPGPPILRTFDMEDPADMREFYSHINAAEAIA